MDFQLRHGSQICLAIAEQEEGRPGKALALLHELARGANAYTIRYAFFEAGRALLATGGEAELERMLAATDELAPVDTSPLSRAVAQGFAAVLASRRDEHATALQGFDGAVAALREIGHPFELAWALLEQGTALVRAGRREDATRPFDEARDIYMRLRADPWIERVDRAAELEEVRT
jgi:hypothetical protein